jgi:ligand-binding SRPBCC domain-containing protein
MEWTFSSPWFKASLQEVVEGFDQRLFSALNPKWMPMKVLRFDGCAPGDKVQLQIGLPPAKMAWTSEITEAGQDSDQWWFVDEGKALPFFLKHWKHTHRVEAQEGKCRVIDHISFEFSSPIYRILLPLMRKQFAYRKNVYPAYFTP